jgi:hypothetical protein
MSPSRQHEAWNELAVRENHGLAVSLLWCEATGRTRIVVIDETFESEYQVDVSPASALDAFHHPFVYLAGRGLEPCFAVSKPLSPRRPERSAA